jgi:hypothetical protein
MCDKETDVILPQALTVFFSFYATKRCIQSVHLAAFCTLLYENSVLLPELSARVLQSM